MVPLRLVLLLVAVGLPTSLATGGCRSPFLPYLNQYCLHTVIFYKLDGTGKPLKWSEAQHHCKTLGGSLAILDRPEKLEYVSGLLDSSHPAETKAGYIYWLGGVRHGTSSAWKWGDNTVISLTSNLWSPSNPSKTPGTRYVMLVPVDQVHGRRFLVDYSEDQTAPAFICESKLT
ncbi:uncharacterized protein LOC121856113 [Homarus americanus]|uniref:C-type lectin domain family 5 member A-like n=1 Tax=Homarus americanus TaxID=6706 RepID=A0A8J5MKG6_HOMAM|nr:uncharacterized protein LOC121856113 [Homarus americanus]KAG7154537.1 C-type lectin domain family 5 member A-like [Homarus americanus]